LYGSSNYVAHNNSRNGLKQIVNFVKQHRHPNIIVMAVPHRFDLAFGHVLKQTPQGDTSQGMDLI
jgi:hypothetical protein